jgi:hypothetical protein
MSQSETTPISTLKNQLEYLSYKLVAVELPEETDQAPGVRASNRTNLQERSLADATDFKQRVANKVISGEMTPKNQAIMANITIQTIIETLERESYSLIQEEQQAYDAINREPNLSAQDKEAKLTSTAKAFSEKRIKLQTETRKEIDAIEENLNSLTKDEEYLQEISTTMYMLKAQLDSIIFPSITSEEKSVPLIVEKEKTKDGKSIIHLKEPVTGVKKYIPGFSKAKEKCTITETDHGPEISFDEVMSPEQIEFAANTIAETFPNKKTHLTISREFTHLDDLAQKLVAKGFKPQDIKLGITEKDGRITETNYAAYASEKGIDLSNVIDKAQETNQDLSQKKAETLNQDLKTIETTTASESPSQRLAELATKQPPIQQALADRNLQSEIKRIVAAQPETAMKIAAQAETELAKADLFIATFANTMTPALEENATQEQKQTAANQVEDIKNNFETSNLQQSALYPLVIEMNTLLQKISTNNNDPNYTPEQKEQDKTQVNLLMGKFKKTAGKMRDITEKLNEQTLNQTPAGLLTTLERYNESVGYDLTNLKQEQGTAIQILSTFTTKNPNKGEGFSAQIEKNKILKTHKLLKESASNYQNAETALTNAETQLKSIPGDQSVIITSICRDPNSPITSAMNNIYIKTAIKDYDTVIRALDTEAKLNPNSTNNIDALKQTLKQHQQAQEQFNAASQQLSVLATKCTDDLQNPQLLPKHEEKRNQLLKNLVTNHPEKTAELLILAYEKGDKQTIQSISDNIKNLANNTQSNTQKQAIADKLLTLKGGAELLQPKTSVLEEAPKPPELKNVLDTNKNIIAHISLDQTIRAWKNFLTGPTGSIKGTLLTHGSNIDEVTRNVASLEELAAKPIFTTAECQKATFSADLNPAIPEHLDAAINYLKEMAEKLHPKSAELAQDTAPKPTMRLP